jgi:tRNA modification GTPase
LTTSKLRRKTEVNMLTDTICAISTPLGEGAIAVLRISGPEAIAIGKKVFKGDSAHQHSSLRAKPPMAESEAISSESLFPQFRYQYSGFLIDPKANKKIDQVMMSFFKAPKSYTGEDMVEISCHGGIFISKKTLEILIAQGARLAERGEFTKRAFLNGKIDLSQAEAVIDLINAKTDVPRASALENLEGKLSRFTKNLRDELINMLTSIEASIDFPEDIDEPDLSTLVNKLLTISVEIQKIAVSAEKNRMYREGLSTAIIGKVNVGKSSLLNALLENDRAIVTSIPGTTRDTIEESINIDGLWVKLIDTAGLRFPNDEAEKKGLTKGRNAIDNADLLLIVFDLSEVISEEDHQVLNIAMGKKSIVVYNKKDKPVLLNKEFINRKLTGYPQVEISAIYGVGLEKLKETILQTVNLSKIAAESEFLLNLRQRNALHDAQKSLTLAIESFQNKLPFDLVSIDLKKAIICLGEITGEEVSEEVINHIFENFCVGK